MSTPIKPWSLHRQLLWLIGVLGLVLLWLGLFAAFLLQGGFGPGKQGSPPGFTALFLRRLPECLLRLLHSCRPPCMDSQTIPDGCCDSRFSHRHTRGLRWV